MVSRCKAVGSVTLPISEIKLWQGKVRCGCPICHTIHDITLGSSLNSRTGYLRMHLLYTGLQMADARA